MIFLFPKFWCVLHTFPKIENCVTLFPEVGMISKIVDVISSVHEPVLCKSNAALALANLALHRQRMLPNQLTILDVSLHFLYA